MKHIHLAILSAVVHLTGIGCHMEANADVVHTTLPAPARASGTGLNYRFAVDFNADGQTDAQLGALVDYYDVYGIGEFVGDCGNNSSYAVDGEIGPAAGFTCRDRPSFLLTGSCDKDRCYGSPFDGPGFIGARFQIAGRTHYGWIFVSGSHFFFPVLSIIGFAYESNPDTPIVTQLPPDCPPVFTGQPGPTTTVFAGDAPTLMVQIPLSTQLSPGFSVQWLFNGQPFEDSFNIAGSHSVSLAFYDISMMHAGEYRCRIISDCGEATTDPAIVNVELRCPPVISRQPAPQTILMSGQSLSLTSGTIGPDYHYPKYASRWFRDGVPLVNDGRVTGADSRNLSIIPLRIDDAGSYTWRVATTCGEATSNPAVVQLLDASAECGPFEGAAMNVPPGGRYASTAPTNLLNPAAVTIEAWIYWIGDSVGRITFKGTDHLTFQVGNNLPGSTRALRFIPTTGVYLDAPFNSVPRDAWVHVAGVYDPATHVAAIYVNGFNVNALNHGPSPLSTPMRTDDVAPFRVGGWIDSPASAFVGRIDEVRVWNSAKSEFQIRESMRREVPPDERGLLAMYRFDEGSGTTAHNTAASGQALDLNVPYAGLWASEHVCPVTPDCPPILSRQPALATTLFTSDTLSLFADVPPSTELSPGFSAQWLFNGQPLEDNGSIMGSQFVYLQVNDITPAQAGEYRCRVVSDCGETISDPAIVLVQPICPPAIAQQPAPATFLVAGAALQLYSTTLADSSHYTSYASQWFRDGVPLVNGGNVSGATSQTLRISSVMESDTGIYTLRVNTECGEATSEPAGVRVRSQQPVCAPFTGSALRFLQSSPRAVSLATQALNPAAVTIEAWIYWEGESVGFITAKGREHLELHVGNHLPGSVRALRFIPTTGVFLDAPFNSVPRGIWSHVAGVYDPSAAIAAIYINGVSQNVVNHGPAPTSSPMMTGDPSPFAIGGRNSDFYPFVGKIDDVRIWNYARSRAEIEESMHRLVLPVEPGLLALYRFDEGAGNLIHNAVPGGSSLNLSITRPNWIMTQVCCDADVNHDGLANSQDFFSFLSSFFEGAWGADINEDFMIDSADLFLFLERFFAGC